MKFLLLLLILPYSVMAFASEDAVYRFETTYQSAGNYHGSIFGISSDVALGPTTKLLPRAENLTRSFDGGPSFNETTLTLGAAQKLSQASYLLGGVSVSPGAQILPRYSASLDPHYAFGASDVGLRFVYSSWLDQDAGTLAPSYLYAFSDDFMISDSVSFVRSDAWYISNATQFIGKPIERAQVRLIPAFGQTLESAGLPAQFTSIALEASYDVWKRVRVGLGGTSYQSTLRSEKSVMLRLEAW